MRRLFWKFSTAGNTTLFLDQPASLKHAMQLIPAEQAGYADVENNQLKMAGGELCINAALAFASLADMLGSHSNKLEIAGQSITWGTNGKKPHWQAWIEFSLAFNRDGSIKKQTGDIQIIHLPGISHALIECPWLPEPAEATARAPFLLKTLGLADSAAGIVWWTHCGEELEIIPVVGVPDAGTFNLEGACGSGSLAVALVQPQTENRIRQPSGEHLTVEIGQGSAVITAPVNLLASGELWQ